MIIYLHGFHSNNASNHEKIMRLKFVDDDVRFINYSTLYPKYDMQFLLQEVHKLVTESADPKPLICGIGLGGYWAERVGFLCQIKQALFNPNLFPYENMQGVIDRPEEYKDIALKCVEGFRTKNKGSCLVFLARNDSILDAQRSADELSPYYPIIWDNTEGHNFHHISTHLAQLKAFKDQ
ncbi:MAG: alpha/beta hydrolase YcfP [Pasteurellaceae bacterium]|nr:alpha/beta hydrolase YcfP [Pasteurellaceae bacterium]